METAPWIDCGRRRESNPANDVLGREYSCVLVLEQTVNVLLELCLDIYSGTLNPSFYQISFPSF